MEKIKIGIIREGKVPPDHRVPLTPKQCKQIENLYPNVEIQVQTSPIRAYKDEQYSTEGLKVVSSLEECDVIFGVKEVQISDLLPNKKYFFFSHTIKKQPYNRGLLQAILEKNIELVDYEVIKDKTGKRLIGFGKYAGIVGTYNAFRLYGLKHQLYDLMPAHKCKDRKEMEAQLPNVKLPANFKVVLTGFGRVGHGAVEVIDHLPITEVSPEEFLTKQFDFPVYTHLAVEDYYAKKDGKPFDKGEFYKDPSSYKSIFSAYLKEANLYIPCHFWNNKAPNIVTNDDLLQTGLKTTVIADISCDIAGPIASTIRSSKIADPIYGYNPQTQLEDDFMKEGNIAVMAVDNLPCELPLDASEDFGSELIKHVLPALLKSDPDNIIGRATETTKDGQLTEYFSYLEDYVNA